MNNYWYFEEIHKRKNPDYKIQEGLNIPEFFKFDGYYIGMLKSWDSNLKTGKIGYYKHSGMADDFTFDYSKTNNFSLEELNSLYEKKTFSENNKNHLLFIPDFDINNPDHKFCKEVIPLHLKAREIAEGIFSQNEEYFLRLLFYVPELKREYGKVVYNNIEQYVNNFDVCEFSEMKIKINSYNKIHKNVGKDYDTEISSYDLFIKSDLYILNIIRKIIYFNQDKFKTNIGSEIKTETGEDLGINYGHFSLSKRLLYTDESTELHIRKFISLKDTFLLRYYFLKFYNKNEHILFLKNQCENGLAVWETNKIISEKF